MTGQWRSLQRSGSGALRSPGLPSACVQPGGPAALTGVQGRPVAGRSCPALKSGVQKNLNTIRKGTTLDQIRTAVRTATGRGHQGQHAVHVRDPRRNVRRGSSDHRIRGSTGSGLANFHAITPFPGTYPMTTWTGFGTVSDELSDFTYQGAAFIPHTMTAMISTGSGRSPSGNSISGHRSCSGSCLTCIPSTMLRSS